MAFHENFLFYGTIRTLLSFILAYAKTKYTTFTSKLLRHD